MDLSTCTVQTSNGVKYYTIDCGESAYYRRAVVVLGVGMQEDEFCTVCKRFGSSEYSIGADTSDGEYGGVTICGDCIERMQAAVKDTRSNKAAEGQAV